MHSSLHPRISLLLGIFDREVMKNQSINLFREKTIPGRELYDAVGISWRRIEHANKDMQRYCNLLQTNVRMCKLTSCAYYRTCHNKA